MAHIETYLPAGSKVTVKTASGVPTDYTTKKDAVLSSASHREESCPLGLTTRTPAGVRARNRTAIIDGVQVWFVGSNLRERIVVGQDDVQGGTYTTPLATVNYDIPDSCGSAFAAKVFAKFQSLGLRTSKSAWLICKGDMPWVFIEEMREMGVREIGIASVDPTETRQHISQAIIKLQGELEAKIAGANESLERVCRQLEESGNIPEGETEPKLNEQQARNRAMSEAKAIEKRLETYRAALSQGASRLGINASAWNPETISECARATRSVIENQARAYKRAATIAAASTDSNLQAMAVQAANSEIPVAVLAGALEDAGEEEAAQELVTTFRLVSDDEAA